MKLNGQALVACALVLLVVPSFADAADKIRIKAADPKTSKALSRGQETPLRITVEYELKSAEAGSIGLMVQEGQAILPTVEKLPVVAVKRGRGAVTLETVLQPLLPSTSYVGIVVSMIAHIPPKDASGPGPHRLRTSTIDQVAYTVR